jgi:deoxyribonuclease-1
VLGSKLRNLTIVLALISLVSLIPASSTDEWPETAQQAMTLARGLRELLVTLSQDAIDNGADWIGQAGDDLIHHGGDLAEDALDRATGTKLSHLLPDFGSLLPDLSELLGDWWPQPRLPAGGGDLPRVAATFSAAKDLLYDRVQRGHRITAYCGCEYSGRRRVDLDSCDLGRYADTERARRVEAEHVFPAAQFGNFRRCWRQPEAYRACRDGKGEPTSGRECCLRVDNSFLVAHNDLHNLIPAVGMINGNRRDYRWGMSPSGERYGSCGIRIDTAGRRVQPPDALRGDIARIMLYMRDTYGFRLSHQNQRLFHAWNNLDPPDAWEIRREERIRRLQGKENDYVVRYRQL